MKIKTLKQNILRFIGNIFLSFFVNLVCRTLKLSFYNDIEFNKLLDDKKAFVLAFWHGDMLIPWFIHRNKNITALVSSSKDGELLVNLLLSWKYKVIRGSSHRGGKEAFQEMINIAKNNCSLAVTPDGPKGPNHIMKAGAVVVAQRNNLPLVLVACEINKYKSLKSWDKMKIPKLFSKVAVAYSDPIYISNELDFEATNEKIKECELLLNKLHSKAKEFVRFN